MSHKRRALISGIPGQDGSYLAKLLLAKDYEVHGIVRRVALEDPEHRLWRLRHLLAEIHLHAASLESFPSIFKTFNTIRPDECYQLAAQSYVGYAFDDEFSTFQINFNGTHHMLAALKECVPSCRFYFAASSDMFGKVSQIPQDEQTAFHPRSAYGISKVAGFHLTRNYREAYGILASCGILYNHESPRRGFEFVTRKMTSHAARIKLGLCTELPLGNLAARRDWGHAREAEVDQLLGNTAKARQHLGWHPRTRFVDLVTEMVQADLTAGIARRGHTGPLYGTGDTIVHDV